MGGACYTSSSTAAPPIASRRACQSKRSIRRNSATQTTGGLRARPTVQVGLLGKRRLKFLERCLYMCQSKAGSASVRCLGWSTTLIHTFSLTDGACLPAKHTGARLAVPFQAIQCTGQLPLGGPGPLRHPTGRRNPYASNK